MTLRWVVLDVGETVLDETGLWSAWAARLGVRPLTVHAALGAVIERGGHHHEALELVRPGFMPSDGPVPASAWVSEAALYDDVRPALALLRSAEVSVAVGGNQAAPVVDTLGLDVDVVFSSASLGAEKPSPVFFSRLLALLGAAPGEVLHVGDRLDNDVLPARTAGLRTAWLRRGPWALLQGPRLLAGARPDHVVDALTELADLV